MAFNELISSNSSQDTKSLLYELTRGTINKEFNMDNYFNLMELIFKVNNK